MDNTILLVENKESDIELTRRAFKKARIANPLVLARNGQEACDYLFGASPAQSNAKIAPLPTLVLLDLNLPLISGLEVLRRIRAHPRTRGLVVVIMTTSDAEPDINTAYALGVNSYIRKPVDFEKFCALMEQLCLYWLMINTGPAL